MFQTRQSSESHHTNWFELDMEQSSSWFWEGTKSQFQISKEFFEKRVQDQSSMLMLLFSQCRSCLYVCDSLERTWGFFSSGCHPFHPQGSSSSSWLSCSRPPSDCWLCFRTSDRPWVLPYFLGFPFALQSIIILGSKSIFINRGRLSLWVCCW